MDKSYTLVRTETINVDIDYYANEAVGAIEEELCTEFEIDDDAVKSIISDVMKDITKKLVEKYLDKE